MIRSLTETGLSLTRFRIHGVRSKSSGTTLWKSWRNDLQLNLLFLTWRTNPNTCDS